MEKPKPPITKQTILGFLGFNLTFGGLLSWVANLIQVLTVKNGLLILCCLATISIAIYIFLLVKYLYATIDYIEAKREKFEVDTTQKLEISQQLSDDLRGRLDKLLVEFRTRSSLNPRPIMLNALVCTKKLELAETPLSFGIKYLTRKLIVIDKGEVHGLTYGMAFAVHKNGEEACLEVCGVDRIESHSAWLSHSGAAIHNNTNPSELNIRLVYPQDIQDSERELAEILLVAEGYTTVRMI